MAPAYLPLIDGFHSRVSQAYVSYQGSTIIREPNASAAVKAVFLFPIPRMAKHSVNDEGDPRKYYTAIPNIILNLGLNPYEISLYLYFKRVAGDSGTCWKSTATIAREMRIGAGTVSRTKLALAEPRTQLGGKPLIRVDADMQNGGNANHAVTIVDIWPENMAELSRLQVGKATRSRQEGARSTGEQRVPQGKATRSTGELKNNPIKNNPEEELIEETPPYDGGEFLAALKAFELERIRMRKPITSEARRLIYKRLRSWDEAKATEALENSVMNRWQGVFEPRANGKEVDNGSHNGRPGGYQTAAERGNAATKRNLDRARQLRSGGNGTVDDVFRRQSG